MTIGSTGSGGIFEPDEYKVIAAMKLAPGAFCGSLACGGCVDIGDGKYIHPPRAGYDQKKLMEME